MNTSRPTGYANVDEFAAAMRQRLAGAQETQEHFLPRGNIAAAINWGGEVEKVKDLVRREADRLEWFALQNVGSLAARPCLLRAAELRQMAGPEGEPS